MGRSRNAMMSFVVAYIARLRFPALFVIALTILGLDLLLPDGLPFLDEILLGLAAALLGSWKKQRNEKQEDRIIDV